MNDAKGFVRFSRAGLMTDGSLVTANAISLAKFASFDAVETNTLSGPGEVRGTQSPAAVPLGLACAPANAACGGDPVVVPELGVLRIGPGVYSDVKIGRRAPLEFDPGEYHFCSLKTFPPAALRSRGDVTIRIARDLKTSRLAIFDPYVGLTQIFVGGKVNFGPDALLTRTALSAPAGIFQLSRNGTFDGAVCARKIKTQKAVHFGCPLP